MKAYKVFNNDWTCNGFQYKVGETYIYDGEIELCQSGFHACKNLSDCFAYYPCVPWNKIAEVELLGDIKGVDSDKQVTNKIKIVKEVDFENIGKLIKNQFSKGVNRSDGVNCSDGVNRSFGVNGSDGVNRSDSVNCSDGVNRSDGVNFSKGVNFSFGVNHSFGVSGSLFVSNYRAPHLLFNKKVSKERFNQVLNVLVGKLKGWHPTFNNLKSLYIKSGNSWKKTPILDAKEISKKEAWQDMPKEAIEYLKSLPEFDQKVFTEVTGLE